MRNLIRPLLSLALLCTLATAQDRAPKDQHPSAENFREWLAFIRPSEAESTYERIGWRNAFWPAVEEARRLGRPLLLWTMNGHPLGCT